VRCCLCDSNRLLSVLDLGATPPCEKLLTVDELDLPEPTLLPAAPAAVRGLPASAIRALITPEDTFTEYAYFSHFRTAGLQHAKIFVDAVTAHA
jgi:hypothetical protein